MWAKETQNKGDFYIQKCCGKQSDTKPCNIEKRFYKQDKYLSIIFSNYRLRLKFKKKMYKLDEANTECTVGNKEFVFGTARKPRMMCFLFLTSGLTPFIYL